ncbi:hypothetical protein AN958_03374, partial [Leucoagaricus sp. SymC.cos]
RTPSYSYRILLSSVCRRWRVIILNMPGLWANIITDLTEDYPPAPLFHLIIERSAPALVHIDLWGAGDLHHSYPYVNPQTNPGISYATLADSLSSIPPHIHRCRLFKVFITDQDSAQAFVRIPFSSAGQLEEMELATQCGQDIDNEIFSSFRDLTTLHRFRLLGFGDGWTIHSAMASPLWSHLSHLDLSYLIPTEEVIWLLQTCTSAVTMRLRARMQASYGGPVICIPNLRALSLSACGRNILRSLRKIEAPKLEVFHLETRREASIYETPSEIPSDDQFVWPSVLNKTLSLRLLLLNDPSSPYSDAIKLLSHDYVKAVPVVKLGIRPAEMLRAKENPHLLLAESNEVGWIDTSVAMLYRKEHMSLLSDIGVHV